MNRVSVSFTRIAVVGLALRSGADVGGCEPDSLGQTPYCADPRGRLGVRRPEILECHYATDFEHR